MVNNKQIYDIVSVTPNDTVDLSKQLTIEQFTNSTIHQLNNLS